MSFSPGTSKWNLIEHRLFAPISQNWCGRPLKTLDDMIELISHTRTQTGLEVRCQSDLMEYKRGIKISDCCMFLLNIKRAEFHGNCNYTLYPKNKKKN